MADEKNQAPVPATSGSVAVVVQGTPVQPYAGDKPVKGYKLKAGKKHVHDGEDVKAGDVVYLTENQAKAFVDKFDPVDDSGFKAMTHQDIVNLRPQEKSVPVPPGGDKNPKIVNK